MTPMTHRFQRRKCTGVTLLELVIALIVIGVIATIAAPSVTGWLQTSGKKTCVANQAAVQTNMRAYAGFYSLTVGATLNSSSFIGTTNTSLMGPPKCAAGNSPYTFLTVVPTSGTRYATCGVVPLVHVPEDPALFPP